MSHVKRLQEYIYGELLDPSHEIGFQSRANGIETLGQQHTTRNECLCYNFNILVTSIEFLTDPILACCIDKILNLQIDHFEMTIKF